MESAARNRVALFVLVVALGAAAIGARLYQLQVMRADDLKEQAHRQHEQQIQIDGRRGDIVDRFGRELAVSLETFSLFAHPGRVGEPEKAARLLSPILGIPGRKILERLKSDAPFVWLARRLDPAVASAIKNLGLPLGNGQPFGFEVEGKRFYPQGPLAVHVIGFANIDQKGVEGIEHSHDQELQGDSSTYLAVRDGRGGMFLQLVHPPRRQPDDVVLSLDMVLQHMVEREIDAAMQETGARSASAILLDPTTGEVLALANRPSADPNQYGKATPEGRRNRAVVDLYEPGSTFKIVTAAAVLDGKAVGPGDLFDCERGSTVVAGRRIRDYRPHGVLTLRQIVERSSNVGMIKACRKLSDDVLYDYIRRFGFGRKTGIELPGEQVGLIADPSRWSGLTHASLSFGHEIGVTALQVAAAVAAVANDGVLVPPRIVLGMRDTNGVLHPAPTGEPRRVISSGTAKTLTDLLEGVVLRGTGMQARVPGYRIAGKTGTAQKVVPGIGYSSTQFIASFTGFGPLRAPRLAGLVVLDSPRGGIHTGGITAAPVFSRIMADALAYLRVPPDDEDPLVARDRGKPASRKAGPAGRRTRDADKDEEASAGPIPTLPGQVPDLRGMSLRAAVSGLIAHGYRARAEGSGVVVAQAPPPGTSLEAGRACALQLSTEVRATR